MPDIIAILHANNLFFFFKILLLILLFIYAAFMFVVYNRVRALNRTIYLAAANASVILQLATFISFLVAVSLFIATLVIV